jgi:hypothetical protein
LFSRTPIEESLHEPNSDPVPAHPINEDTQLKHFYEWYLVSGLYEDSMNNVGDPSPPTPRPGLVLTPQAPD